MSYKVVTASLLLFAVPVSAQTVVNPTSVQSQNVAVVPQQVTGNVLRAGAPVPVVLSEALTTKGKQLKVGQRVQLEVAQDVLLNGRVVIPARAPVDGVLTEVRNKGMWGKSGHLAARILYMTVYGRQIRLSGTFDEKGSAGGVGAVAVSAFVFLPAGFFMTGTSAKVPAGTVVNSFLEEDVPLAMPVSAQGPLPVGAPAAPVQVQPAAAPGAATKG